MKTNPASKRAAGLISLFCVFAFICAGISARNTAAKSDLRPEPEVRIGLQEWSGEIKVSARGKIKVLDEKSGEVLWKGDANAIVATMADSDDGGGYHVAVGSFRSYETAAFAGDELRRKFDYPCAPAHPKDWMLWLGPFDSLLQAAGVWSELKDAGVLNADIIPKPSAPASYRVEVVENKLKTIVYRGAGTLALRADAGAWTTGDRTYRGSLLIVPDSYGTLTLVNLVRVDDYIRGVLAGEMPATSELESLKAQAVIARTYLMNGLGRHRTDGYDLCAGPDCQVYKGASGETEKTDRAVKETRGMLLYDNGEVANPLFHSTCGGRTAEYGDAWPGNRIPYLRSVNDGSTATGDLSDEKAFREFLKSKAGNCSSSKYFRWNVERTEKEMEDILQEKLPSLVGNPRLKVGDLKSIRIIGREKSGRLSVLLITTSSGSYRFRKDEIRWSLGGMKSTFFTLDVSKDKNGNRIYVFSGAGWGHGVGLCQIGAMELGRKGWKFEKILSNYYPGTTLTRSWR